MKKHIFFFVVLGVLWMCRAGIADDKSKPDSHAIKLVQRLGANGYAVREAAEKQLIVLGGKAKAAVLAGTRDVDAEIARRCVAILPQVRAAERKALVEGTGDWPGPEGKRFKELVGGDSPEARKLFALMAGDDRRAALVEDVSANPGNASKLYLSEVTRLQKADSDTTEKQFGALRREVDFESWRTSEREAVSMSDVALVLFLGTSRLMEEAESAEFDRVLRTSFYDLTTGTLKEPSRKLYAAWLEHKSNPTVVAQALGAALAANISEVLPFARRTLGDRKASGESTGMAALVLGKWGSSDDLVRLSAHRDNASICWTRKVNVQVRDVVAATSLVLNRQDFKRFGIRSESWRNHWSDLKVDLLVVGAFESDEERETTLKKAWEWLDKQPGAPKPKTR